MSISDDERAELERLRAQSTAARAAIQRVRDFFDVRDTGLGFTYRASEIADHAKRASGGEDKIERVAADLWRHEHPTMSVFACDVAMKETYRARARQILEQRGSRP